MGKNPKVPVRDGESAAVWVDRAELHAWDKNPRKNDGEPVKKVMESIKRFGFAAPIIARTNGEVIAGHTRLKAAEALGIDRVPVRYMDLDPAEAHLLALADNKLNEEAEWDAAAVASILSDYSLDDAALAGWDSDDLDKLADELGANDKEVEEDEVPEPPAVATTKPGDLWILGKHRLLCGDSTKAEDVARLMAGSKAEMMVTDPPYGVEYDPSWRSEVNDDGPNSKRAVGKVANDDRADWTEAWQLFDGNVAYVWHADRYSPVVAESLEATGLEVRYLIIWAKQRHTFGRGHYHHQHEPCWCVVRKGATASWAGDRKQTTLWQIDNNRHNDTGHGTQKPVECMARAIRNHNANLIYDPFLGSGTTLIAAEQLGRKCYGMEISPAYCDVIVKRWETLTGKTATLEEHG